MAMDKGLALREVGDALEVSGDFIDIMKLGWTTSYVYPELRDKIHLYKNAGINIYLGGTLFEAFVIRDQFEDYLGVMDKFGLEMAEVSDGSIEMPHDEKCEYIRRLSHYVTVVSEVGSKDAEKVIPPDNWVERMNKELEAGAWKVIGEGREGGNVGLFHSSGDVRSDLIDEILTHIPEGSIIWEAPKKAQQAWFIKLIGSNVNLGNIDPHDVISLETLRLGLRGDTFHHFLNND